MAPLPSDPTNHLPPAAPIDVPQYIKMMLTVPVLRWLQSRSALGSIFVLLMLGSNILFVLFLGSEQATPTSDESPITVLIWHWPFNKPLNLSENVCFDLYNIPNCRLTDDRSLLNQSHVVVFHQKELGDKGYQMPHSPRTPGQMWVWTTLESPSNTFDLGKWNNIFNWTLTYREDSDIFVPYGKLIPMFQMPFNISIKTGLVTWAVSNYHRSQKRASFFKEFSSYLNVDVYGEANRKPLCPSCLLPAISRYYFYLALENSIHRDYITEKLWQNSFLSGAVPIVLGPPRENYERFIPSASFIHVSDFPSPKHLAEFLGSMTLQHYQQYHSWRQAYRVKIYSDWRERFCTICSKYPHLPKSKVYSDLEDWFTNRN
ncbi:alpha-(1,3)-fucosyltransferase 7 [Gastrophryne carolinensis]